MQDLIIRISEAQDKIQALLVSLDLPQLETKLAELEKQSEDPDLWENPEQAQSIMKKISTYRQELDGWKSLQMRISDAQELVEIGDESLRNELEPEIDEIEELLGQKELSTLLSGKYDHGNALLTINAGAGGTDSQDWSAMLQRMYLRWAEKRGFTAEILDTTPGEEAGIKTVTISIEGPYAYGYLRSEKGVHRLVRLSPFDANSRRHTSFTQVEILPQVDTGADIEVNPKDLKIETYRSAGAGGQNVQKNDTAVRITHIPSGIVATCQNERSQSQNRENALKVIKARLLDRQREEEKAQLEQLRGEYQKAEWGSQIRSYVLHPYQMVKDHRTNHEIGNAQSVLDGEINEFIAAYLRSKIGTQTV
ncbi:MAG: peptide chain release factor 2 [Anaerolineae bacterium]|nr:peptide chain release factor 2 [Anaerolineae bacterium]